GGRLSAAGELGAARLSQAGLLQGGRSGRALRRVGAAGSVHVRDARRLQVDALTLLTPSPGGGGRGGRALLLLPGAGREGQLGGPPGPAARRRMRSSWASLKT